MGATYIPTAAEDLCSIVKCAQISAAEEAEYFNRGLRTGKMCGTWRRKANMIPWRLISNNCSSINKGHTEWLQSAVHSI